MTRALVERERDRRDVGGVRVGVGSFEQALAQVSSSRLVRDLRLRGACSVEEDATSEDRRGFARGAEDRAAKFQRAEQHRGERQQEGSTTRSTVSTRSSAERNEHRPDLLRAEHRAVPAEAHRPPFPFRHARPGLDAGLGS